MLLLALVSKTITTEIYFKNKKTHLLKSHTELQVASKSSFLLNNAEFKFWRWVIYISSEQAHNSIRDNQTVFCRIRKPASEACLLYIPSLNAFILVLPSAEDEHFRCVFEVILT